MVTLFVPNDVVREFCVILDLLILSGFVRAVMYVIKISQIASVFCQTRIRAKGCFDYSPTVGQDTVDVLPSLTLKAIKPSIL